MHFKIPLWSLSLKLSDSKLLCKIPALNFFVKNIPLMAFWHPTQSDKLFIQLLICGLSTSSLLRSVSGFDLRTVENGHLLFFTSIVYGNKRPGYHLRWLVFLLSVVCPKVSVWVIVTWIAVEQRDETYKYQPWIWLPPFCLSFFMFVEPWEVKGGY